MYCERFNGDSASQLARIRVALDDKDPVLMKLGIRAIAEMSEKIQSGETVLLKNKDSYEGRVYNKLVILRLVNETSKSSRRQALVKIAEYLNSEVDKLIRSKELKPNQPKCRVRSSCDRTPMDPANFRKLDEVVSPTFAVRIVAEMYTGVGPTWGIDNPSLASMFFSAPYAKVTRETLFNNIRNI